MLVVASVVSLSLTQLQFLRLRRLSSQQVITANKNIASLKRYWLLC